MRAPIALAALALCGALRGQGPLINELCASNHGCFTDDGAGTPDWIELYNPSARPVSLAGWRLAINGRQHVIEGPLSLPPNGHLLLRCDGRPERGPEHLGFTLRHAGGAVLLVAPDGSTIADLFSYPALPPDASIGRLPDGAAQWGLIAHPTPGRANGPGPALRGISQAPVLRISADGLLAAEGAGAIRYTTDGSDPRGAGALRYAGPVPVEPGCAVRAIAQEADRLPSAEALLLHPANGHAARGFALAADPAALWGDSTGIYAPGAAQNHTRRGKAWERPALAQVGGEPLPVGIRIFGSGSRSLGKRSFKLYARKRYGSPARAFAFRDGTAVREGVLRADASPHAFLRNTALEEAVRRYGLQVLVQPSEAAPLFLNGAYWGLYRWMPAKDAEWLRQRSGAESLDVLAGPAAAVRSGKARHFEHALGLLLQGAPADSIDAAIDTRSLIDLACIDLWTGRADHDLNVRCYRPRQAGGRWRWVLYDTDLWSTPEENSVERMCSATLPEAPYVPQLLAHPALRQRLLARLTALQATALARLGALADSIHAAHAAELQDDHRRWELELEAPAPLASLEQLNAFAAQRPAHLFAHLAARTGLPLREAVIEAPLPQQGRLLLDGLPLEPGRHRVRCFEGVPVQVEAIPAAGHRLEGWRGISAPGARALADLAAARHLRPLFRTEAP